MAAKKRKTEDSDTCKLWKHNGEKWIEYAGEYPTSPTPDLTSYLYGVRLIKKGWIPYPGDKHPSKSEPLDIGQDSFDLEQLEAQFHKNDSDYHLWGKRITQFIHSYQNKPERKKSDECIDDVIITYTMDENKYYEELAVKKAAERYKSGGFVPHFLLQKVIDYLCNQRA